MAKVTVTSELFKLSLDLGRTTWFGNLAFGLLVVLILWRENQLPAAAIWWSVLAAIVVTRAWHCQWMNGTTFEALDAIRRYRPTFVLASEVPLVRAWLDR